MPSDLRRLSLCADHVLCPCQPLLHRSFGDGLENARPQGSKDTLLARDHSVCLSLCSRPSLRQPSVAVPLLFWGRGELGHGGNLYSLCPDTSQGSSSTKKAVVDRYIQVNALHVVLDSAHRAAWTMDMYALVVPQDAGSPTSGCLCGWFAPSRAFVLPWLFLRPWECGAEQSRSSSSVRTPGLSDCPPQPCARAHLT